MRLSLYLARAGVCSRRAAEKLIAEGHVTVNGVVVTQMGTQVPNEADVQVDGKRTETRQTHQLWLVNKPTGVLTTHNDPEGRTTIWQYLAEQGFPTFQHWITVGRLDLMSEGLILVTNDGAWSQQVARSNWPRVYRVRIRGPKINWAHLGKGITIDGIRYKSIHIEEEAPWHKGNRWVRVTLVEGKNREIRKIMDHFGQQVSRLIRLSFGPYHLEQLGKKTWMPTPFHGKPKDHN
jgi:23S rRNA pseudouridine2605 synthase